MGSNKMYIRRTVPDMDVRFVRKGVSSRRSHVHCCSLSNAPQNSNRVLFSLHSNKIRIYFKITEYTGGVTKKVGGLKFVPCELLT